MKTGEVEQVLLKLKDPLAASEPKEIERTPCPMCDRSFKVTIRQMIYGISYILYESYHII